VSTTVVVKLRVPVVLGTETVTELELKPNARFYKDTTITAGQGQITFNPYDFAVVGVRLAGRPAASAVVDKMDPADMMEVAQVVLGFLTPDPMTGSTA
jgi:hypothetical protein